MTVSATYGLRERIKTLEESAGFIVDLANGLPGQAEWLWDIEDRLRHELMVLQHASQPHYVSMPDST